MTQLPPLPDAVHWYEGMLLAPQHFQQAWLREEALVHHHLSRLAPYHHGVRTLAVDATRLVVGLFRVTQLDAVLPDGLTVRHPAGDAADLEVNLAPLADRLKEAPATVHLAVPAYRPGAIAKGEQARFVAVEGPPAVDENTGDNEQPVLRVRPRPTLFVGEDVPQRFVSMPIARVTYLDEAFRLTDYVPPGFAVAPGTSLHDLGRHVARRLREKATFLAGRLRAPPGALQAGVAAETRQAVQCLVAGLPVLETLLDAAGTHPFALYLHLAAIAGQVTILGPGLVPPVFDGYRHDDPLGALRPLVSFIERMIDTVSDTYVAVRFAAEPAGFRLKIDPAWIVDGALVVGVRVTPGQSETDTETWMSESLIASAETMGVVRERRLRGAARRRIDHEDRLGLVPERGLLLFRVTADPAYIEAGRVLEVENPSERQGGRRPAELLLYTATPAKPGAGEPA